MVSGRGSACASFDSPILAIGNPYAPLLSQLDTVQWWEGPRMVGQQRVVSAVSFRLRAQPERVRTEPLGKPGGFVVGTLSDDDADNCDQRHQTGCVG